MPTKINYSRYNMASLVVGQTGGEALSAACSEALIATKVAPTSVMKWCEEVIVSLDGSREIHNTISRVLKAYENLEKGVTSLKTLQSDFQITVRSVVQRDDYQNIPQIIEAEHSLNLNGISFLLVDVSPSAFNSEIPWEEDHAQDVSLHTNQICKLEVVIEEIICRFATDFETGFIAKSPQKLRTIPRYFDAILGQDEFSTPTCSAHWVSTVIESDGTVYPCFFHHPLVIIKLA